MNESERPSSAATAKGAQMGGGARGKRARLDARARVFAVLAQAGAVSRAELARRTQLAASTVGAAVSELEAQGLVVEPAAPSEQPASASGASLGTSNGAKQRARPVMGRPPVLVALHRRAGLALGIDLGRRHVHVALADLSHRLLADRYRPLEADAGAGNTIEIIVALVEEIMVEVEVSSSEIVGVGMGLPGPVHRPTGVLGDPALLPGWVGVRVEQAMSEALGRQVEVENDANLGALSESMWGAGRGVSHLAYLKAATGIGAGLIVDGTPYTGAGGTAGEIGHTVVDPRGPICRCGNRGCLETIASSAAIVAALRDAYGEDLTIAEVIARALEGDPGCQRAIADAGRAIGIAVATLCNLVNPRRVVIGGDLPAAGELLLEPLRGALRQGAIRSAAEDVEVVVGTLGDRVYVLGAVALVLRRGAQLMAAA